MRPIEENCLSTPKETSWFDKRESLAILAQRAAMRCLICSIGCGRSVNGIMNQNMKVMVPPSNFYLADTLRSEIETKKYENRR